MRPLAQLGVGVGSGVVLLAAFLALRGTPAPAASPEVVEPDTPFAESAAITAAPALPPDALTRSGQRASKGQAVTKTTALPDLPALAGSATPPQATAVRRIDLRIPPGGPLEGFRAAGLSAELLDTLDAAFITRFDLYAQLTEGRAVTLWLDSSQPAGKADKLVAAELETNFGRQRAGFFQGPRAPAGWYDARGLSLAGPLLGRPVQLSRVTSRFGERFHPITGIKKKHAGTDYGVPVGTPVKAAGQGTVREIGSDPKGGGNFLKVAHADGWESWYLHLDRFKEGLKKGQAVGQGDVIAYSGNTGTSTGPHLHYELRIANIAMDPEKTLPVPSTALGPLSLPEHQAFLRSLP